MVGSLVLAACGGSDSESTDVTDGGSDTSETTAAPVTESTLVEVTIAPEVEIEPQFGGTLRYAIEADVDGLNPTQNNIAAAGYVILNAVFDTLASYDVDDNAVPDLAESFTPNDDYTQWEVKLRSGVLFHDGTTLDAEAVVANYRSLRASALPALAVNPFFPPAPATADEPDPAIDIVDDLTVRFNLLDPNLLFPATLTGQLGMVASPTWLAAAAADPTLNQQPVGTGPFKFESRSEDSVTRLVRNDDWWGGDVYLDAVEFLPVTDTQTRGELLINGEVEALHTTGFPLIAELEAEGFQQVLDETGEESFGMLNASVPPFDDLRARQAVTLASPIEQYNLLINEGLSTRANGRFIPSSPNHNPDAVQLGDDIAAAQPLVAEYCAEKGSETNPLTGGPVCTDGKINMELQWSGPSVDQTRIADLLEQSYTEAGFNVIRQEIPQDDHIIQVALGQYNMVTWRQFGSPGVAPDNVWLLCRTVGFISLNWPRYCDEERDAKLLEAQVTEDPAARAAIYQEVEQMINDAATYIYFNHTRWSNAFADNVYGVCNATLPDGSTARCTTNGAGRLHQIWLQ